jgi:hypothetical protein
VFNIDARGGPAPPPAGVVPIGERLSRYDRPTPDINRYDQLLEASR